MSSAILPLALNPSSFVEDLDGKFAVQMNNRFSHDRFLYGVEGYMSR